MYQKIKTTTRFFWKTAIIVAAAIFIADVANAQSKHSDIVGVWQGNYDERGGTGGKGTLTLTINDDMNGVIEFVIKRRSEQLEGSYKVSVNNSKGVYNVTAKEIIKIPNNYAPDNFSGTVSNGIFRGKNFQFKRITTAEQLREQQAEIQKQQAIQQAQQNEANNKEELEAPKFEINYPYKQEIINSFVSRG